MNRLPVIILALAALSLAGCAGLKEQQSSIDQLGRQVAELRQSLGEANARIDDMGNRLMLMREKLEASSAEMERLGSTMLPSAPPEGLKVVPLPEEPPRYSPGPSQKAHTPKQAGAEPPEAAYNRGQDLFMGGRYAEARDSFASFLKAHPRHSLSDNALYWIGESHYSEKDFEKALEKFNETADMYPWENKAPDALLKAGFSCIELRRNDRARELLERLISRYPASDAAAKAVKALSGLKVER